MDEEEYGDNVGRFIKDHRDYVVKIGFEGFGYQAQKRDNYGHGAGKHFTALTLDELAEQLNSEPSSE